MYITVLIEQIVIPTAKVNAEKLKQLKDSIKAYGLMNLIIVKELEKDKYEIVDGNARYFALKSLGNTKISCQLI